MTSVLYLHGFASSPQSKKAQYFKSRFSSAGADILVPDLVTGGFRNLTLTGQLRAIEQAAAGRRVSLIGSSMGGYLAALYAARHPEVEKLVLFAPAFGFARRWAENIGPDQVAAWESTGALSVMNYAEGGPAEVGWQLMEDARQYEEEPAITQPCLIYHGVNDTVVPVEASRSFARARTGVELREVDDGHELLADLEGLCRASLAFLAA